MYKHLDRIFEIIFLSDDLEITKNCMKIVLKIFADKKIKEQVNASHLSTNAMKNQSYRV